MKNKIKIVNTLNIIKNICIKIYRFYKNRNLLIKIILWVIIFLCLLQVRYISPSEVDLDISGKKSVILKDETLYLYKYKKIGECIGEIESISTGYCAEKIKIEKIVTYKNQKDLSGPTIVHQPVTAMLGDGSVVYTTVSGDKWQIKKWSDGGVKLVKEYEIFDLGRFARRYKEGKLKFDDEVIKGTGLLELERFQVRDNNTLFFLDFMVTEVDVEKPVEVAIRERYLNIETGEESMRETEYKKL